MKPLIQESAELAKLREPIEAKLQALIKSIPPEEMVKDENQEKWRKMSKELYGSGEYKKVSDVIAAQTKAFNQFLEKPAKQMFGEDDMGTAHGFVWLYLRK